MALSRDGGKSTVELTLSRLRPGYLADDAKYLCA
jgi:hypothetical protein